jgi:TolA-binding protein
MSKRYGRMRAAGAATLLVLAPAIGVAGQAAPAWGQDAGAEARMRRLEAEVRALQRKVFPGDSKLFQPEIAASAAAPASAAGTPASTPLTDLLARMESVEGQLARMTAQYEQNSNRLTQLEARAGIGAATTGGTAGVATPVPAASADNLAAMTGGASAPKPAVPAAATTTATTPAAVVTTPRPATAPAAAATTVRPATTAAAAGPTAQRLAAVRAIEKPQSADPADDEYSYGYRLWEAKFFPESAQQLKMYLDKYPRHSRTSFGRNLLGRALLDDGKPREAASWFLQNYQSDKTGGRAPDSLLFLAVAMKQLNDTNRACIALAEFGDTYAAEASGRLKSLYDDTRAGTKCNR